MQELLKQTADCLEAGLITPPEAAARKALLLQQTSFPAAPPSAHIEPPTAVVMTEEGQRRSTFFSDRIHRMGTFEKPAVTQQLFDFFVAARSGSLPLSSNENSRLQVIKEVWGEWVSWVSNARDFPTFLPNYDFAPTVSECRRFLAEICALWMSYDSRMVAPGAKEPSFGGLVASFSAPRAQIESVGLEVIRRSPGQSFISALVSIRTPLYVPQNTAAQSPNSQPQSTPQKPAAVLAKRLSPRHCTFCNIDGHLVEECRKFKFKDAVCAKCGEIGHTDFVCGVKKGHKSENSSKDPAGSQANRPST